MTKSLALYDAKNRLTDVVRQVEDGPHVEITRHGKPVAALVGINEFREILEARRTFSSAFARYRSEWKNFLADEAAEGPYNDPFAGLRSKEDGREVEL